MLVNKIEICQQILVKLPSVKLSSSYSPMWVTEVSHTQYKIEWKSFQFFSSRQTDRRGKINGLIFTNILFKRAKNIIMNCFSISDEVQ
jgi:hypothetical protein